MGVYSSDSALDAAMFDSLTSGGRGNGSHGGGNSGGCIGCLGVIAILVLFAWIGKSCDTHKEHGYADDHVESIDSYSDTRYDVTDYHSVNTAAYEYSNSAPASSVYSYSSYHSSHVSYYYDEDDYDEEGYDRDGYDREGYDDWGIDEDGYDENGNYTDDW